MKNMMWASATESGPVRVYASNPCNGSTPPNEETIEIAQNGPPAARRSPEGLQNQAPRAHDARQSDSRNSFPLRGAGFARHQRRPDAQELDDRLPHSGV